MAGVLFDVDGTLVDSASDICGAIQTVLSSTPQNAVEESFLKRYIGYHLIDLFQDLFPGKSSEEIDQLVVEYRAVYPARKHKTDFGIHFLFSDVTVFLFWKVVMGKFLPVLCSEPVFTRPFG